MGVAPVLRGPERWSWPIVVRSSTTVTPAEVQSARSAAVRYDQACTVASGRTLPPSMTFTRIACASISALRFKAPSMRFFTPKTETRGLIWIRLAVHVGVTPCDFVRDRPVAAKRSCPGLFRDTLRASHDALDRDLQGAGRNVPDQEAADCIAQAASPSLCIRSQSTSESRPSRSGSETRPRSTASGAVSTCSVMDR